MIKHCTKILFAISLGLFSVVTNLWAVVNVKAGFLSADNGLGSNYVRNMVQDPRGYIWMGTTEGLLRYDGYSANMIVPGEGANRRLMTDSRIQSVALWQDRFVWIRLRGRKFCCYDTKTDQFVDYTGNSSMDEPYRQYHILDNGEIWLTDDNHCKVIRFDGMKFSSQKFDNTDVVPKEAMPAIPADVKGVPVENVELGTDNRGNILVMLKEGQLWHIDKNSHAVTHFKDIYSKELLRLNESPRYSVVTDHEGMIWISTYGNGFFVYEPKTGETTHFLKRGGNMAPIQTNYLLNMYEDRAGNIWVCQENMGVACINRLRNETETVYFTTADDISHTNSIHLLTRLDNVIYVGNRYNGLKLADGQLRFIQEDNRYQDDIVCVCSDKQGVLWMGTRQTGVYVGKMNLQHNPDDSQSITKGKISDIVCDHQGRIWISFFDGGIDMAYANGKDGYVFQHFFTGDDAMLNPRKMLVDHHGYLWLCSNEGLYVFHPNRLIANRKDYLHLSVNTSNTQADEIHTICETSTHMIMAGTMGYGMAEIDNSVAGKPKLLRVYTQKDGMGDPNVQQLIEDVDGNIWVGTDHGLIRYTPSSHTFMNLAPSSLAIGNMFVENAVCRLDSNRLAFGTRHGIVLVNPRDIKMKKPLFRLLVTDIEVNGVSIRDMDDGQLIIALEQNQPLQFNYNQNSLNFHFSDFVFNESMKSRYTIRLSGYDQDWIPLSDYNFAVYKNLPSGHYTLEVKAQDAYGMWNGETISLPIVIRPPFWATWWAYLIYFIIVAAIAYFIYHHFKRINDLRTKIKVENELTEFKMRFFTNISHEFRTPLTIIRGAMEHVQTLDNVPGEMKQPLSSISKSVKRLLRMINELLEFSKMHEQKLHLAVEETDVVAFLRDIFSTFNEMAEQKHINYMFTTTHKNYTMYVDRGFLDKIAYNLISNALKYTPSRGEVKVSLRIDDQQLTVSVEDTGIGISKEKQKQLFTRFDQSAFSRDSIGIGLHLTNELVHIHHGTIAYQENTPQGSIFQVVLPAQVETFAPDEFMQGTQVTEAVDDEVASRFLSDEYRELPPVPINQRLVLIVEDDSDVRQYLKNEMQRYFIIDEASDGLEALEKMNAEKPELIVTDVVMPQMDGYELTRRVRRQKEWADLPIIMLTALTAEQKHFKGIDAGADVYIEKPFSPRILIAYCCQLLEQRDHLKALYAKAKVGHPAMPEVLTDDRDRRLRQQLDIWLQSHIADPTMNIDVFAQSNGYGRTTFFKKVKQLTGMTPNDYIRSRRMALAADLLRESQLNISEIAYKVGFADQYYFSKSFKSYYGITPTNYREGKSPLQQEDE